MLDSNYLPCYGAGFKLLAALFVLDFIYLPLFVAGFKLFAPFGAVFQLFDLIWCWILIICLFMLDSNHLTFYGTGFDLLAPLYWILIIFRFLWLDSSYFFLLLDSNYLPLFTLDTNHLPCYGLHSNISGSLVVDFNFLLLFQVGIQIICTFSGLNSLYLTF